MGTGVTMKIKSFIILIVVPFIAACGPGVKAAPTETATSTALPLELRVDNFSLVYRYFACSNVPMYTLDASHHVLIYTPLGDATIYSVPFRLTDQEMDSIYQKAVSIDLITPPFLLFLKAWRLVSRRHPPTMSLEY